MSGYPLVSLGYEGRTVEELTDQLVVESVSILVDVRLTPLSRKPGMSKRLLAAALTQAGIQYVHLRALGNPKENRAGLRAGHPASQEVFRQVLADPAATAALHHVAELLETGTVALLCFERDYRSCHRHLVAEELRRGDPTLVVVELQPQTQSSPVGQAG